ncbi:MAG: non-ribosomal peptide synthetase [Bacteroidota bacterium]
MIEQQAVTYAHKEAVRYNGTSITYEQLNEASNQLAALILSNGIQTGDSVGLLVDRSQNMLIALLAILKCGAAYIPLDPEYPKQRIIYMLENSGAKLVLTEKKYSGHFISHANELLLEDAIEKAKTFPASNPARNVTGADLAYIIYTSGSTGNPKGVMVEHHSIVNLLWYLRSTHEINERDRLLAITTISFDIAVLELFLPLICGALVVITDAKVSRDGFELLEIIQKEKINLMQATPVTWKIMLAAGWEDKIDLTIFCCGEALSIDLAMKLVQRCSSLYNYYGPTETTVYSTGTQIHLSDKIITIGKPLANTQVYILDEDLQLLPADTVGEVYIGGQGVARGYMNMPELTAERFINDTFSTGNDQKIFRTGDIGKWTGDGTIYLMGRADHQIKIRGFRIEPGEIEACLLTQPGIRDALVIAREDTPGNKSLVAYIICTTRSKDPAGNIQKWKRSLQHSMPDFMIPPEFVLMDSFPLLPNGKINRAALPKPEKRLHAGNGKIAEHDTSMEKLVTAIWAELLGIDDVGLDEDFFDLGGHSLIAVQIMTRLEKETGKRLPIAALFEASTIRKLSLFLEVGDVATLWESLVPVKASGHRPPLYIVHGDGLNVMVFNSVPKHMDAEQPVFGLQPRGLNGIDDPDESMEEIAANYVAGILKHNPEGPYFLAGYSFGGIVAFEMAKQLKAAGHEVKMLAMFDTSVGNINYTGSKAKRLWEKIMLQFPKMLFIGGSLFKYPGSVLSYQGFVVKRKWHTLMSKLGLAKESEEMPDYQKRIIEKQALAFQNYNMTPYDGTIDLFRVRERVYFLDDPIYLGWKNLSTKGISIHQVPGDHRTFLLPPYDKVFAQSLQSTIDERANDQ